MIKPSSPESVDTGTFSASLRQYVVGYVHLTDGLLTRCRIAGTGIDARSLPDQITAMPRPSYRFGLKSVAGVHDDAAMNKAVIILKEPA